MYFACLLAFFLCFPSFLMVLYNISPVFFSRLHLAALLNELTAWHVLILSLLKVCDVSFSLAQKLMPHYPLFFFN
jgi:hypothetical protein